MPPFTSGALIFLSAFCLFSAAHHLIQYRNRSQNTSLLFAVMAVLGCFYALSVLRSYDAATVEVYSAAIKMDLWLLIPFFGIFLWFTALYTGYRPWILLNSLSFVWVLLWVVNGALPHGLLASEIQGLADFWLPWGDRIHLGETTPSVWTYLYYLQTAVTLGYATFAAVWQHRKGERQPARIFLDCLVLAWMAFLNDLLMDLHVYRGFYLAEWAILVFVSVMSLDLIFEGQRQEEFFEGLVDSLNDAIFLHDPESGVVLHVNQTACRMYGIAKERIVGRTIGVLSAEEDGGDEKARGLIRLTAQKGPRIFDWLSRRMDGSLFWSEVSLRADLVAGRKRVIAVVRDVSERRRSEEALRESEQRFRNVIEASPMGMHFFRLEPGDRLVFAGANAAADRILGVNHAALVGKLLEEALPSFKGTDVPWRFRLAAREGVPWYSEQMEYEDDRIKGFYEIYAVQTEPLAMVAIFLDVTQRRKAEQDRRKMEARMRESQRLESLGLLAGGIAHDFNNLLQAVRGHTEILVRCGIPTPTHQEALDGIDSASRRAADLCRQLLAYAGKGKLTQEIIDLRQSVMEIGKVLEVGLSKKAKLEYRFDDDLPAVKGDGTQIRQVLLNLMTNASEALGEDAGTLTVSVRTHQVQEQEDGLVPGRYLAVEVKDTGCGMDEETQSRIFEPFFTTKFTGRGLGLAAVRGIVLAHLGALRVKSGKGVGTTMTVLLPASEVRIPAAAPLAKPKPGSGVFRGKVLLADDDEDVRFVTRRMLERLGFQVAEAVDGRQAVERAKAQGERWAAIILDLTMPDLDGVEAFRLIRRAIPQVPVVLISGYNQEDVASRMGGLSGYSLIQKPFNQAELEQALVTVGLSKS